MNIKSRARSLRGTTARWGGRTRKVAFPYADLTRQMLKSDDNADQFGACLLFSVRESTGLKSLKDRCSDEDVRKYLRALVTVMTFQKHSPELNVPEASATLASLYHVPLAINALSNLADLRQAIVNTVGKKLKPASAKALKAAVHKAREVRRLIQDEIVEPEYRYRRALEIISESHESEPALAAARHFGRDYRALLVAFAGEADRILGFRPVGFMRAILNSKELHEFMAAPPDKELTEETATKVLQRAVRDGLLEPISKRRKSHPPRGGQTSR